MYRPPMHALGYIVLRVKVGLAGCEEFAMPLIYITVYVAI